MSQSKRQFNLILNHTVKITRRTGFTTTAMGQRRSTGETVIAANASVWFDMPTANYLMRQAGNFKNADFIMFSKSSEDVQEGDLIYPQTVVVGMTLARALETRPVYDFAGLTHHLEVAVERVS